MKFHITFPAPVLAEAEGTAKLVAHQNVRPSGKARESTLERSPTVSGESQTYAADSRGGGKLS